MTRFPFAKRKSPFRERGADGSNPPPSSGESDANLTCRRIGADGSRFNHRLSGVAHQPITGLLATSDLFAAIIGLALQRMIADIFSGLALTVERPFTIGDWLEIGSGLAGKIIEAN